MNPSAASHTHAEQPEAHDFQFNLDSPELREMFDFLVEGYQGDVLENLSELLEIADPVGLDDFVCLTVLLTLEMFPTGGILPEIPAAEWRLSDANKDALLRFLDLKEVLRDEAGLGRYLGHLRGRLAPFDDPEFQALLSRQSPAAKPAFCVAVVTANVWAARTCWMMYRAVSLMLQLGEDPALLDWDTIKSRLAQDAIGSASSMDRQAEQWGRLIDLVLNRLRECG